MSENLRDVIEKQCAKVLKDMNMPEEQMWQALVKLSEYMMSEKSKAELLKIKDEAKKGIPEDLEKMYHMIFLSGYNLGMADQQRKEK